jgi:excisionase family DNA binding protein
MPKLLTYPPARDGGRNHRVDPERPQPPERLTYRLPDVAWLTGLSLTAVQRLVGDGRLPAVKVGRAVLVRREDLQEFTDGLPFLKARPGA